MKSSLFLLFSLLVGIHTATAQECALTCPLFCAPLPGFEETQPFLCSLPACQVEGCPQCQDRPLICAADCEKSGILACYNPFCSECPFRTEEFCAPDNCPYGCTAELALYDPTCFQCEGEDPSGAAYPGPPCDDYCSPLLCPWDPSCSGCQFCSEEGTIPACDSYCDDYQCGNNPLCADCEFCRVPKDECCDADCLSPDYSEGLWPPKFPKTCKDKENCGGCLICKRCETWCSAYMCGYGICEGCDFCQPGEKHCPIWCSQGNCEQYNNPFPGGCSDCDHCQNPQPPQPDCDEDCTVYACTDRVGNVNENCKGCDFCQEGSETCAPWCGDISCGSEFCNGCKFCETFKRCDSWCSPSSCNNASCEDCTFCDNGKPADDICNQFCSKITCSWQREFVEAEEYRVGFCDDCPVCKRDSARPLVPRFISIRYSVYTSIIKVLKLCFLIPDHDS